MAVSDIFTLKNSIAPRLIRCLYIVALIVIAVFVVLGVMRGVRIMTFTPQPRPAMAGAPAAPGVAQPAPPRNAMAPRFNRDGRMGPRRYPRMFGNPPLDGAFLIFWSLLRGAIAVMIVRILAEIGLTILAMPRRTEI